MTASSKASTVAGGVRLSLAAALLVVAILLHASRDPWPVLRQVHAQELLHVRSPQVLGRMVLEFDAVAADLYWIRAIQHYGGERLKPSGAPRGYERLYPLLDMTTSLDPTSASRTVSARSF